MKTFFILGCLTFVHSVVCNAQFVDSFLDGNYTTNPSWSATPGKFIIDDASQLKLAAPAEASSAFISTSSSAINNAYWEFYVQMDFNPSNANFTKIYLVSDQADLSGPLNGYFVRAGNTNDEVSLYRQDGEKEVVIISDSSHTLNISVVKLKVKVLREASGNWQLFSDVGNTGAYTSKGNVTDNTYLSSSFFGVHCTYTATRSDKFYFDDFIVTGDPFVDLIPPVLQEIKVISAHELALVFSEDLDVSSVEKATNYFIGNGLGIAASVQLQADQKTINITYLNNFPNAIECTLTTSGVKDVAGNIIANTEKTFTFFKQELIAYKDIIITEIFADPDPKIGLPDAEYIEIYNRSTNPISLKDFTLTDGKSTSHFDDIILFPEKYLIVTPLTTKDQFNAFDNTMGIASFPTLNNAGDSLVLKDVNGVILDVVNYDDTWYKDDDKKQGGWSLELIDLNNICSEVDNWIASENTMGGTPGKQNSTNAIRIDNTGPGLLSAIPTSANTITLQFSEKLDKQLPTASQFIIDPLVQVKSVSFTDATLTAIELTLMQELQPQMLYEIMAKNIFDCTGNVIQDEVAKVEFGLPETPDSLDVVINEILFNPRPTGVDFVEVYNKSSKFIDLKDCSVASFQADSVFNVKFITTTNNLLKPLSFLVFTTDSNVLKGEYISAHEKNFCQVKSLPSFNDDEGSVAFISPEGKVIDHFQYSKTMHSSLINDEEGVSLERIDFNKPTQDFQNWTSASSTTGFATPGYINANSRKLDVLLEEAIKVDPLVFVPVTGTPNFIQILFHFDQGGYVANVKIYNTQGQEIKQIASNALLGTEGIFRWDGDEESGNKARVGYYVVSFEIFNAGGIVKTFRKRVVVATNFN